MQALWQLMITLPASELSMESPHCLGYPSLHPGQFSAFTGNLEASKGPAASMDVSSGEWTQHYSTYHRLPANAGEMLKHAQDVRLDTKV